MPLRRLMIRCYCLYFWLFVDSDNTPRYLTQWGPFLHNSVFSGINIYTIISLYVVLINLRYVPRRGGLTPPKKVTSPAIDNGWIKSSRLYTKHLNCYFSQGILKWKHFKVKALIFIKFMSMSIFISSFFVTRLFFGTTFKLIIPIV